MLKLIVASIVALSTACQTAAAPPAPRVADRCVQTIHCIIGTHWDKHACACVPDAP